MNAQLRHGADSELVEKWYALQKQEPGIDQRESAAQLGVPEGRLIASFVGQGVTKLEPNWMELVTRLESFGEVMALTRNENAVIQKHGVYRNIEKTGHVGLVLDSEIDLRLFIKSLGAIYAMTEECQLAVGSGGASLQIFDKFGAAIHQVFETPKSERGAFQKLFSQMASNEVGYDFATAPVVKQVTRQKPVDKDKFLGAWAKLKDTHDFHPLLRRFRLSRQEALVLGEGVWSKRLAPGGWRGLLESAAITQLPIMVFVASSGVIQIHTGSIKRLGQAGDWFNILDPRFNLHLLAPSVVETWVVRKPTVDGIVTSIELFDGKGDVILYLFGKRKPGQEEDPAWRECVESISRT